MNLFKNKYDFVREELKDLPEFGNLPKGKFKDFGSRIGYALSLGLKEKEIFFFGLMQWLSVVLAYLLWIQMLYWIPQPVWDWVGECLDQPGDNDGCTLAADIPLFLWGILCIFLAAFPIGILSSAMGTTHFLHKNGEESTVAKCLSAAFSNAFATWNFHFVDGYITVGQIIERLPSDDKHETALQKAARRAASEALYYAWKLGIAGVLPSLVLGNGVIESGKNSIKFVKANFIEIAKLRAAYSLLCWVVGILAYVGAIITLIFMGDEIYALSGGIAIAKIYLYMIVPIAVSVSVVMIFLRPIYVLTICDMYSDYLSQNNEKANLPNNPKNGKKAFILFVVICALVALVAGFREQIGLTNALSDIPDTSREIRYIEKNGIFIEYDPSIEGYYQCIHSDAGYKISLEITYDEYQKQLKEYCRNKFPEKIILQ
tara:strand:- start:62 stop:1351 length:1290 start_codon:yes stop_codon:yes gene_type:complete